jgi:hypothetical protein
MTSPDRVAALFALLAFAAGIYQQYAYLFVQTPVEIVTSTYPLNPFNELKELAGYIRANSQPEDRIAVHGSEPELYFYARRRAATRFLYVYPLMEPQPYALQMQKDMIAEVESEAPRFIAIINVSTSWIPTPDSPTLILGWPKGYVATHYRRVAVADILSVDHTEYRWGKETIGYKPRSISFVVLYERVPIP